MDKTSEAMRTTRKERGRLASQKHREAQKTRGIPDARRIDEVLLAIFIGLAETGGLQITVENRRGAITAMIRAVGWDTASRAIRSAVERRLLVHEKRYGMFEKSFPGRVERTVDS